MWALIEQEVIITHCRNTSFAYHNEFSKYMKIEGVTSDDIFYYLFDVGARNFLSKKEKKYLNELFEKQDPVYFQLDEDFDDYLDNYRLEDIIGDEGMQNLNIND